MPPGSRRDLQGCRLSDEEDQHLHRDFLELDSLTCPAQRVCRNVQLELAKTEAVRHRLIESYGRPVRKSSEKLHTASMATASADREDVARNLSEQAREGRCSMGGSHDLLPGSFWHSHRRLSLRSGLRSNRDPDSAQLQPLAAARTAGYRFESIERSQLREHMASS